MTILKTKILLSAAVMAATSLMTNARTCENGCCSDASNPFYSDFTGIHGTVPFSKINNSQWEAAIDRGIELARQEIDAIVKQRSMPDFENTIVALERVGADLNRVLNVFYPLLSADSDDQMMEISMCVSPKLSD